MTAGTGSCRSGYSGICRESLLARLCQDPRKSRYDFRASRIGPSISLEEAGILCAIERYFKARTVLEIGTSDGGTTLALAANLEDGGTVTTLDLPPDFDIARDRSSLAFPNERINVTSRIQLSRQFRSHPLSSRIHQVFGDSAKIDWNTLGGPFDLIFIDGCHTSAYVESDTANALRNLATPGVVVWHDYGLYRDVSAAVDSVAGSSEDLRVVAIRDTRLAVGLRCAVGEGDFAENSSMRPSGQA
jgi:predicted O-methyltransferase YrrM